LKCLQIGSLCCLFRRSLSCSRPSRGPRSENKNPANSDFASELVAGRTNKNGSAGAWRSFVAWSGETSCRTSGRTGSRPVARIPVVSTRSRAIRSGSRNPQARDRLALWNAAWGRSWVRVRFGPCSVVKNSTSRVQLPGETLERSLRRKDADAGQGLLASEFLLTALRV